MVQPDRPQMAIKYGAERMQSAGQVINKRIKTRTDNIFAFPPLQWLCGLPRCYIIRTLPALWDYDFVVHKLNLIQITTKGGTQ